MKNTIIHLLGFPGTGKYTIAKEIVKQADFRLVDNHLINIPLFSLIQQDGDLPQNLSPRIWQNVGIIWSAVFDTMIHLAPENFSFVLTNALTETHSDHKHFKAVENMAVARKALFVPVRIICSVEENEKRIVSPERKNRIKGRNPKAPAFNAKNSEVIKPIHSNTLTLNVSDLQPGQAAEIILKHVRASGR